jgi:pimeloyl-ACP methyl ester carboxylesterase
MLTNAERVQECHDLCGPARLRPVSSNVYPAIAAISESEDSMSSERGLIKTPAGYLHYRAKGHGRPVLLFHINQQSSSLYLELMDELASDLRLIAPDYPGYGMSDAFTGEPEVHDFANAMFELVESLRLEKVCIIAEAFGTFVASEMARSRPALLNKMLFLNCPFQPIEDRSADVTPAQRPADPSGFPLTRTLDYVLEHDAMHAPMHPTQSWMDRVNTSNILAGRNRRQALDALYRYDLGASLDQIRCPVEVLVGEHFYYCKFRNALSERLGGAPVTVLDGARFCIGWERAKDVALKARAFFASE